MEVLIKFRGNANRLVGRVLQEDKQYVIVYSDFFDKEFVLSRRDIKVILNHSQDKP